MQANVTLMVSSPTQIRTRYKDQQWATIDFGTDVDPANGIHVHQLLGPQGQVDFLRDLATKAAALADQVADAHGLEAIDYTPTEKGASA